MSNALSTLCNGMFVLLFRRLLCQPLAQLLLDLRKLLALRYDRIKQVAEMARPQRQASLEYLADTIWSDAERGPKATTGIVR
jgi:hypothetical protein